MLKEEFTGIIPKGTPLAQIIPFKRESWSMETDYLADGELDVLAENGFNATMQNHYRILAGLRKDLNKYTLEKKTKAGYFYIPHDFMHPSLQQELQKINRNVYGCPSIGD